MNAGPRPAPVRPGEAASRGAAHLHALRAVFGVSLSALILANPGVGGDALAWRERGLWLSLAMATSALVMLIYLRRARPPAWLHWLFPPIDAGAVLLLALGVGQGAIATASFLFLVVASNGLLLRQGPLLFSCLCASFAWLALATLSRPPMPRLDLGFFLISTWLLALLTAGVIRAGQRLMAEALAQQEARNQVLRTFGQHVSPQVVDALLAQGEATRSAVRHVSVMFLDIRGFTTFSEARPPEEVVALLNDLFAFMIEEVNRHEGIINKFLGDGFMAVFGAPISSGADARNSVAAARAILAQLERRIADGRLPPVRLGIGIHTGPAVTGSVGSEDRKEYTLIGDVVNVASRVEGLSKELGAQLLVTEPVWVQLQGEVEALERHEGVAIRGRSEGQTLYRLA